MQLLRRGEMDGVAAKMNKFYGKGNRDPASIQTNKKEISRSGQ